MSTTTITRRFPAGLWVLTATHAANDFYTGAVAALLPFLVVKAHYDYAAVAGVMLAATALSSVAQPAFGYLSDRFGARWLSLAGLLLAGAGVALSGLVAESYLLVWIVIAASGIGVAAYHPAATVQAREVGGGSTTAMSIFSVGGNLGVAVAPSAVVLTVGTVGLCGTGFLILPALVLGGVYLVVFGRDLVGSPRHDEPPSMTRTPDTAGRDDWVSFAWLTLVLAFWSVAYVGTSSFIALYSIERFESSAGSASIALSIFPAAGALGTLGGGALADRFGRLQVVRAGYVLAAGATAFIVLAPSPAAVVIATGLLGIALFIPFAAQITLAHSYLPQRIGIASGVTLGLTLSLGGLVSPVLGRLADHASVQAVFSVMAAVLLVAFALSFVLRERPPSGAAHSADTAPTGANS